MKKMTLVVMAAGIGSRYGGGIKQLEPVGPNGEIIMDYSIYAAIEAGFNKIVFVIKKDIEKEFKEILGHKVEEMAEVAYAYQELSDIPQRFAGKMEGRIKPWGTGQAILCCKNLIQEPFLVINADDYYGKQAYRVAYEYLTEHPDSAGGMQMGMVGFVLKNTLSDNGTVTRGICQVDGAHMLTDIEETYEIKREGNHAVASKNGRPVILDLDSPVSMNMWALPQSFFDVLESGFEEFLETLDEDDKKTEYLLPRIIGEMLRNDKVRVKALESDDQWFGMTYKEDRPEVEREIRKLIKKGLYPEKIYRS